MGTQSFPEIDSTNTHWLNKTRIIRNDTAHQTCGWKPWCQAYRVSSEMGHSDIQWQVLSIIDVPPLVSAQRKEYWPELMKS